MKIDWNGCPAAKYYRPLKPGCACEYVRTIYKICDALTAWNRYDRAGAKWELEWSEDGEECAFLITAECEHWRVHLL